VTPLTEHFDLDEFALDAPIPEECVPIFKSLCEQLLEPLRIHFDEPILVTSGYRTPASNAAAHGVSNSQHVATDMYCAADWYLFSMHSDMRPVFDLVRSSAGLQFDQLILEHGAGGDIIHSSWSRALNRREALEGETANQSGYKPWPAVPGIQT
jgi:zinc D-Ala-D-Ala carboxypeptidase